MATYTPKLKEALRAHGCYFEPPAVAITKFGRARLLNDISR